MENLKEKVLSLNHDELKNLLETHDVSFSVKHVSTHIAPIPPAQKQCMEQHGGQCGFCAIDGTFTGC